MPDVAVVIPWRPTDTDRCTALTFVLERLSTRHPHWQIVLGRHDDGPWCKATAVDIGLVDVDAPALVIHDADVWCDELAPAIAALDTATWAVPHLRVHRLRQGQHTPSRRRRDLTEHPYIGFAGGGITAITTAAYRSCPLDPRFTGWGQEDEAFALALRTLHGSPWRGEAPLYHWWHEPQPRHTRRIGSDASAALLRRYRAARRDPDAMRALLEEVTRCSHPAAG